MAEDQAHTAPSVFLLMVQYNGRTVVPLDQVCRDFFGHLTVEKLLRRALRGDIVLPIVRIETSQKAQRGVHLVDLAAYIDKRRAAALKGVPTTDRYDGGTTAVRRAPLKLGQNPRKPAPVNRSLLSSSVF
jgi:Pyocin activator protein PrtN